MTFARQSDLKRWMIFPAFRESQFRIIFIFHFIFVIFYKRGCFYGDGRMYEWMDGWMYETANWLMKHWLRTKLFSFQLFDTNDKWIPELGTGNKEHGGGSRRTRSAISFIKLFFFMIGFYLNYEFSHFMFAGVFRFSSWLQLLAIIKS